MRVWKMVDDVIRKFGFEAKETIKFCEMAEAVVSDDDVEMLSCKWFQLMSITLMDEEDE